MTAAKRSAAWLSPASARVTNCHGASASMKRLPASASATMAAQALRKS